MIVFFGPAGAGKSVQGQILAARHGWRWLSSGQLLRDSRDPEILEEMRNGGLVGVDKVNQVVSEGIKRAESIDKIILDGFPRLLDQAKWLVETQDQHARSIQLVIVLEVPRDEIEKRLHIRGRVDDTKEAIEQRLAIYRQEMYPILTYFADQKIPIAHIEGVGTVGQVHDKIEAELTSLELIK